MVDLLAYVVHHIVDAVEQLALCIFDLSDVLVYEVDSP